jgi:hypothetical protein
MDLLDRQYQRLRERDGVEFWRELPRFYETITNGPRQLVSALAELREQASGQEREFRAADAALIPELVELRNELVRLAPEADAVGDPETGRPEYGLELQPGELRPTHLRRPRPPGGEHRR